MSEKRDLLVHARRKVYKPGLIPSLLESANVSADFFTKSRGKQRDLKSSSRSSRLHENSELHLPSIR